MDQRVMTQPQVQALSALCTRYGVLFEAGRFTPALDLPDGWVSGWVGGSEPGQGVFVGCSPEGEVHS